MDNIQTNIYNNNFSPMSPILTYFAKTTVIISHIENNVFTPLGTGFIISNNLLATNRHVIAGYNDNLAATLNNLDNINDYQDLSKKKFSSIPLTIKEENPFSDLAILQMDGSYYSGYIQARDSLDNVNILDELWVLGYPHSCQGRISFTVQKAYLGAKLLLTNNDVSYKYGVLNMQSLLGQSGSPIYSPKINKIIGILSGTYAYDCGLQIGSINPSALNQTTEFISAEYIDNMLER